MDGIDTIRVWVAYELDGVLYDVPPVSTERFAQCTPIYEEIPGWTESTFGITNYDKLPAHARAYLKRIEQVLETPIDIISTGPDREQTIIINHPYA